MDLLGMLAGYLVIVLVVAVIVYFSVAAFLNRFNKLVYGKGTIMAWLPITNVYLLGKLAVNKLVGY